MAVGASFADLAIILLDATQGVLVQTRRHARICALMGIRYFVFAVNKMDLIGYDQEKFNAIQAEILQLAGELGLERSFRYLRQRAITSQRNPITFHGTPANRF